MTTDAERPAVWVVDPADPTGATRHPGREHGRFVDDAGEHVIVLFERPTGLRDYRVVSPERVLPRDEGLVVDVVAGIMTLSKGTPGLGLTLEAGAGEEPETAP